MIFLVDSSVWIIHLSRNVSFDLRNLCKAEDRVMCLPVYQEILQGIRDETAFRSIKESLDHALMIEDPMERSLFQEATGLYRMARRQGYTIRSGVDCLIAACAIRHNIPVLHRDRDYGYIAKVSELVEHCL